MSRLLPFIFLVLHLSLCMGYTLSPKYRDINIKNIKRVDDSYLLVSDEDIPLGTYFAVRDKIHGVIYGETTRTMRGGIYEARRIRMNDLFESLSLSVNSEKDIKFCFGFNQNGECNDNNENIVLFNNDYLKLETNSYVGFGGDIFMDLEISLFEIKRLQGGFRDLVLNGRLGLLLEGEYKNSFSYSHELISPRIQIASFDLGPVPVDLWLLIPVNFIASGQIDANLEISAGVNMNVQIGDLYFDYEHGKGINVVKPTPIFDGKGYLTTSVSLTGSLSIELPVSVQLHLDNAFELEFDTTPSLEMNLSNLCVSSELSFEGDIEGSVNILNLHRTFGPEELYDYSMNIPQVCV
jgi:hypothetical protein